MCQPEGPATPLDGASDGKWPQVSAYGCGAVVLVGGIGLARFDPLWCVSVALLALAVTLAGLHHREPRPEPGRPNRPRQVSPGEPGSDPYEELEDPVRWCFLPSTGSLRTNMREAVHSENDLAAFKFLVLHKPTHEKEREVSGHYPYSWHLHGRKRIWEVRVQVRFKQPSKQTIYFGLEMRHAVGHQMSAGVNRIKGVLLAAIKQQVGEQFYHSPGDDPTKVAGEAEPPTFALPLWAIDQFHIANPGEEPDLNSDLTNVGIRRTSGLKKYIHEMRILQENLSADKVYTFCFWGISQYIDVIQWQFQGMWPMPKLDANKICGSPPIYVTAYHLVGTDASQAELEDSGSSEVPRTLSTPIPDRRHLISRKQYLFKVALWSNLKPPSNDVLAELNCLPTNASDGQEDTGRRRRRWRSVLALQKAARMICGGGH